MGSDWLCGGVFAAAVCENSKTCSQNTTQTPHVHIHPAESSTSATQALSARTAAALALPPVTGKAATKAASCGGAPGKGVPCFHSLYTTLATLRGSGAALPRGVTPQFYREFSAKVRKQ